MMLTDKFSAAVFAVAVAAWAAPASAALYTFESAPLAASSPYTESNAGLSATFAGSAFGDPGAFAVSYNSTSGPLPLYAGLSGAFLGTSPFSLDPASPLTITFGAPVTALSLNFALGDRSGALSLSTNAGGAANQAGAVPAGYAYAEGVLRYTGATFTVATLRTTANGFAIDNVNATVAATAVPEPATLGLLGLGLAGLAARRRRA